MTPGIYAGMSMEAYLAAEAASASVIKTLLSECPRAAWHDSFLNSNKTATNATNTDRGTIVHSLLLEGSSYGVVVIDPNDHPAKNTGTIPDGWTNQSIRAARDKAR